MPDAPDAPSRTIDDAGYSRRAILGAGALALVLGGGAGWLDRRNPEPASTASPGAPSPTTSTSSVPPTASPPAPVSIPEIGTVDPGIVRLGRAVIDTTGEDDLDALIRSLPPGDGDPLERADAAVRDDFVNHRTVAVDGWVLAVSEARAAAIIALLCDDASC